MVQLYSLSEMIMNAENDGQVFNSCGAVALAYIVLYISYVFIYIYRLRNNSLYLFQFVIENHVLPCLYQLLTQNHKKSIKKEACWTISNITAWNRSQIQAVIEANTILPLVYLLQHAEFDIKKEAAWAISNATSGGSHDQIRIVTVCLEGLENILKCCLEVEKVTEKEKEKKKNNNANYDGKIHRTRVEEKEEDRIDEFVNTNRTRERDRETHHAGERPWQRRRRSPPLDRCLHKSNGDRCLRKSDADRCLRF
ncbi:Importin subunit alpha-4 [Camellia lanceoleosa]|uniref:Importin subunit alpha-4 n=1 Tax=Camellia lanceoleosa TaxID=1840588 RepID=A0ACC0I7P9_9ERIC|nr:Importin subunit alpha-4 [Camellia lanceoleosa]